jgi:BirA family biotin operon repressor/biotin-[acetyl-CoA-carboxylase] ligase
MHLPLSAALVPSAIASLDVVAETGSTNDDLVAGSAGRDDLAVLVAASQTAGRGRHGRAWLAPPGTTIAISVLLRPRMPGGEQLAPRHYGWLPLVAGVAMAEAVGAVLPPERVGLKWPNDVQVDGRKVSGILAELVPADGSVVVGAGVNLSIAADALPTPVSSSLALEGAELSGDELADVVLSGYLRALAGLYREFVRLGGDAEASGIRDAVVERCSTLGRPVRVELPGGDDVRGVASAIDATGRLLVTSSADGRTVAVAAGDVTHLRLV